MTFSFLDKIFSVTDDNELRILITILGIKFRIPKKKYSNQRKQHPYYEYKKNKIDITTLPPAEGDFREFQLATLSLLLDFDAICKQNNIHYWLDFGTLMGAVRHKGFIPWDDDIDLGIFRKDYEKIMDIVNNNTINPDIRAIYNYKTGVFIKITHKKCNQLFLDLFPVDEYGEIISEKEQLKETKKIKKIAGRVRKSPEVTTNFELKRERIAEAREKEILIRELPKDKAKMQYIWGIDFYHLWKNWFTNYDVYFPFKTITFEGYEFPCMNNPDKYLKRVYGDYMAYPKKMRLGHNIFLERSTEEKFIIKSLIKEKGLN